MIPPASLVIPSPKLMTNPNNAARVASWYKDSAVLGAVRFLQRSLLRGLVGMGVELLPRLARVRVHFRIFPWKDNA